MKKICIILSISFVSAIAMWNIRINNQSEISVTLQNISALSVASGAVTCVEDKLDTCVLSTGDRLQDQDEKD
jgi:hypothetical protein